MDMKIVGITVAILVSITVLAGVLIPVLDDATATTDTFKNEGYYNMKKVDSTTNAVISWAGSNPNIVSINGEDLNLTDLSGTGNYTIFGSDSVIVRWSNGALRWYSDDTSGGTSSTDTLTVTIASGTVTFTKNATTTSTEIGNDAWIASADESDYVAVMKEANKAAYVLGDSEVYLIGVSVGASIDRTICVFANGSIDDGLDIVPLYIGGEFSNVVFSEETAIYTKDNSHENLYNLDKYEFNVTYTQGGEDKSADLTYSYFIVPAEVTAERTVHFTDNQNALFAVIPMLVIVAILIGVVALVIRSRLD